MSKKSKINLGFKDFYGKCFKITDYINEGDEIITTDHGYYFRVKVIHIYAGVVFYKILKILKIGTTKWKDVTSNNIEYFPEDCVYALCCYPTEVNIFDWFHPSILNKYTLNDLYGGIKINYEGKFKNSTIEEYLKEMK